jgi:hypothetical protein
MWQKVELLDHESERPMTVGRKSALQSHFFKDADQPHHRGSKVVSSLGFLSLEQTFQMTEEEQV